MYTSGCQVDSPGSSNLSQRCHNFEKLTGYDLFVCFIFSQRLTLVSYEKRKISKIATVCHTEVFITFPRLALKLSEMNGLTKYFEDSLN